MILDGFKFSINFFKDNVRRLSFILLAPWLIYIIFNFFLSSAEINEDSMKELFLLIPIIISQVWTQCLIIIAIADKDKNRTIPDLYIYTLYKLPIVILWSLFVMLAVALGILLFIIPGIYIACRYSVLIVELLLSTQNSTDAARSAFTLTENKVLQIFIYFLAIIPIFMSISILTISLGNSVIIASILDIAMVAFSTTYTYYLYQQLVEDSQYGT